jgi:MoaA/NifB/PqqE/SkfB family radical SAM enzyme
MCSYRQPQPNELTMDELELLARQLGQLGLRRIVYSGGEPLTRRDFAEICKVFQTIHVKQSLLTNGLLLSRRYDEVKPFLSEIIVSIDGPSAAIHDQIRGVQAFEQIVKGIQRVVLSRTRPTLSIRTVVQRRNFREMGRMVEFAKTIGADRISFLAADVTSDAFHRDGAGVVAGRKDIMLNIDETIEFKDLMNEFVSKYQIEIKNRFVSETPGKLFHLLRYFEALAGSAEFPTNVCNAPMMSAVITSTGELLPCFFLPSVGNIRSASIDKLLNNAAFMSTRRNVKEYTLQRCHECVCTLNVRPSSALMDRF